MPEEREVLTWEGRAGGVLASPGGRADARERVVLAWEGRPEARDALASPGGRPNARGRVVFAGEGRAVAGDALASPGWAVARGGVVLAWEGTGPSLGGFTWEGVIPSLGGWPGNCLCLPVKLSYLKLSYYCWTT